MRKTGLSKSMNFWKDLRLVSKAWEIEISKKIDI